MGKINMISDVIETLNEIKEKYGDLPCVVVDSNSEEPFVLMKNVLVLEISKDDEDHTERWCAFSNLLRDDEKEDN